MVISRGVRVSGDAAGVVRKTDGERRTASYRRARVWQTEKHDPRTPACKFEFGRKVLLFKKD